MGIPRPLPRTHPGPVAVAPWAAAWAAVAPWAAARAALAPWAAAPVAHRTSVAAPVAHHRTLRSRRAAVAAPVAHRAPAPAARHPAAVVRGRARPEMGTAGEREEGGSAGVQEQGRASERGSGRSLGPDGRVGFGTGGSSGVVCASRARLTCGALNESSEILPAQKPCSVRERGRARVMPCARTRAWARARARAQLRQRATRARRLAARARRVHSGSCRRGGLARL